MKFSTKSSYGLRAMIRLAQSYKTGSLSLAKIARSEGISLGYLERLAVKLKKEGLIKSSKGVNGGYSLSRDPRKISIQQILEALEGTVAPFYCAEVTNPCPVETCPARKVWQRLDTEIRKTLSRMSLAEVIK